MNLQQLQAENAILKSDLKTIKDFILSITENLGVTINGEIKKDFAISDVIKPVLKDLTYIQAQSMLPDFLKSTTPKETFMSKLDINKLLPLVQKYKNL
jgi:hypothetical protein